MVLEMQACVKDEMRESRTRQGADYSGQANKSG